MVTLGAWHNLNTGYLLRSTPEPVQPQCSFAYRRRDQWVAGCARPGIYVRPANDDEWAYPPWQPYDWFACSSTHKEIIDAMIQGFETTAGKPDPRILRGTFRSAAPARSRVRTP
jgi:hypothetical protein